MPVVIPTSGAPAPRSVTGSISGPILSGPIIIGMPISPTPPVQIMGFVPVISCTFSECRQPLKYCCFEYPVFGNITSNRGVIGGEASASYENDLNSFKFYYGGYGSRSSGNGTLQFIIQQCDMSGTGWSDKVIISNSNYGTYIPLNYYSFAKTYTEFVVNWGKVLYAFGPGCYRIKVLTKLRGAGGGASKIDWCGVSPSFKLRQWNCEQAHHTVKLEAWKTGTMDDPFNDGKSFNLCGLKTYDSIRFRGYIGERGGGYEKEIHEYDNRAQTQVRNDYVPMYKGYFEALPLDLHIRLQTYAMMSDTTLASDYNINNSDYTIKRRWMINQGDYKPEYSDRDWHNLQTVEVEFGLGYRSVSSSSCCSLPAQVK